MGSNALRATRRRRTPLATAVFIVLGSVAYAQAPTGDRSRDTPDFTVQVGGYIVADFSTRMSRYADLRRTLETGLPALTVTDDPADIERAEHALATQIRAARRGATQGEIFTPAIGMEFRKALLLAMNADTLVAIMDENPGAFSHRINGTYPKRRPLSTVPANILALLPRLPDDIQYRFLGRHLVLHDTRANVILDRLPCAIQCTDGQTM